MRRGSFHYVVSDRKQMQPNLTRSRQCQRHNTHVFATLIVKIACANRIGKQCYESVNTVYKYLKQIPQSYAYHTSIFSSNTIRNIDHVNCANFLCTLCCYSLIPRISYTNSKIVGPNR